MVSKFLLRVSRAENDSKAAEPLCEVFASITCQVLTIVYQLYGRVVVVVVVVVVDLISSLDSLNEQIEEFQQTHRWPVQQSSNDAALAASIASAHRRCSSSLIDKSDVVFIQNLLMSTRKQCTRMVSANQ
ncbi:unnamed protein product [Soboliphyme baturini]|uniref:Uncharacterized protein n=1 Tax=Soboliphyme baturini TaxID=241478 RepID=A0A183IEI6_9BILA|nr:unnamed protein product [Soboliphyme baturini]